jgi:hypothetical protein
MASETTNDTSIKRRKTEQGIVTCLSDLPIGILEHTAGFLATPSRALFAVALTIDGNNNSPGENYSSIAGSDWGTLDFGEIEKELAARLSDYDISTVLQYIEAVNTVKRLRLTHCTNITGAGLDPLRGSTIIEQIDLSLAGDGENPRFDIDPPISCLDVLPILDSIIAAEGCALNYLQFPFKWRAARSTSSYFHEFIERYNEMRDARDTATKCFSCNEQVPSQGYGLPWIGTSGGGIYGVHCWTCWQCSKYYCYDCRDEEVDKPLLSGCHTCQWEYCRECVKLENCENCGGFVCEHCSKYEDECNRCHIKLCSGCHLYGGPRLVYKCSYCGVSHCNDCNSDDMMHCCEYCDKNCCNSCRLRMFHEGGIECVAGCIKLLPHEAALIHQSRILQQEVEQLKNENRELKLENNVVKREIRELKRENKALRDYNVPV